MADNTARPLVIARFADGTGRLAFISAYTRLLGLDHAGRLVIESVDLPGFPVALTECCQASGKGGERGVICRACYRDVPSELGGTAVVVTEVVSQEPYVSSMG